MALNGTVQNDQTSVTTVSSIRPAHKGQVIIIFGIRNVPPFEPAMPFGTFLGPVFLRLDSHNFACTRAMKLHTRVLSSFLARRLIGVLPKKSGRKEKYIEENHATPPFLYSAAQHRVHASSRTCNMARYVSMIDAFGKWRAMLACVSSHHTHFVGVTCNGAAYEIHY